MRGSLRIRLFGAFEVEGLEGERFGSRKARTLLKLLALGHRGPVGVDRLLDGLWPGDQPSKPADQLAVLVSRLRHVVGTERIPRSDAGYALEYDWLDLDAFEELGDEAFRRARSGNDSGARTAASAALSLVRGPLLADEPDNEWADAERLAFDLRLRELQRLAAEVSLAAGLPADAIRLAHDALVADPYDEGSVRVLMAAYAADGRPASALIAYAELQERLRVDLGTDPSAESQAVHGAVLRDEPVPGVRVGTAAPAGGGATTETLPGRGDGLAFLDGAFERVRGGALQVVIVEGEAGIGKTRLVEHWIGRVQAPGALVLSGRSHELGRSLPLQGVFDALHAYLSRSAPAIVSRVIGQHPLLASLVGPTAGDANQATAFDLTDPVLGRALMFGALADALRALAGDQPVVLFLDDAHHASESTFEWLHFVTQRAADVQMLIVVALRQESGISIPDASRLVLGPLDVDAVAAIVGPDRARVLHERSGGNPLFLNELAAARPDEELPASIRDAVLARCEDAGEAAATLRSAAVMGPVVDIDLLAAVLGVPPIRLLEHLEEGVRRYLVEERGPGLRFRHELVREALAATASESRRALLHREAARVLSVRPGADPVEVARHAGLGGDADLAASALVDASRVAVARFDFEAAERMCDEAIAYHDGARERLTRARVRIARFRFPEAAEDARFALGLGGGAPALELAGWAAYFQRDLDTALRLAEDGARLADDPEIKASCMLLGGRARHSSGDMHGADRVLRNSLELATGPAAEVGAIWLGGVRVQQARCEEALELLRTPPQPGSGALYPFAIFHKHQNVVHALAQLGRIDEAIAELDRFDEECERRDAPRYAVTARNYRGWILRNIGDLPGSDEANQEALDISGRIPQTEPRAWALTDLVDGRLAARDHAGALEYTSQLEALMGRTSFDEPPSGARAFEYRYGMRNRLNRARLAIGAGEYHDAEGLALQVVDDARAMGIPRYLITARLVAAWAAAAAGSSVDLEAVQRALDGLDEVAAIDGWWLTAETAARLRVDRWWSEAERRVVRLCANAGDRADRLRGYADALFEQLGARSPA